MRIRLIPTLSLALAILSVIFFAGNGLAAEATPDDFHISAPAEFFVLYKYAHLRSHKAIAVGPLGRWDAYDGMRSAAEAAKTALNYCNKELRTYKSRDARGKKCVLFDVDGKRTGKAKPIGAPFGTPAPGDDRPWLFGKEWAATSPTKRGTMLLLHGCSGYTLSGWQMAWANYYRAAGFRVILPNSFADARDPHTCGLMDDTAGFERQTRNLKLRVAQTLRTISGIRRKYPGEALYLHGHSEGGWIAQALGERLDGIILTGTMCGFGSSTTYLVAKGVPILHIAGTKDHAFVEATSAKALRRYCRQVTGDGKVTLAAIPGMDHYAAIWRSEVQASISKFLRIPVMKIARPSSDGVAFPQIPEEHLQYYQKAQAHKAIASDKNGVWSLSTHAGDKLYAEEDALFACDDVVGGDVFLDGKHMHQCILVDVNGERLVK